MLPEALALAKQISGVVQPHPDPKNRVAIVTCACSVASSSTVWQNGFCTL
jgi:hypothetical protein